MTRTGRFRPLFFCAIVCLLAAATGIAAADKKRLPAVSAGPPVEAVQRILANAESPEVDRQIEGLGRRMAGDTAAAEAVLSFLESNPSVAAATLRAELLLWLARGNDVRDGSRQGEMPTNQLGARAGALLDHADPFVCGMAEWAIAIRLGAECEGRITKPWPGPDGPSWYGRWLALDGESLLECDYVRQVVALGQHRNAQGLMTSAETIAKRIEGLTAWTSGQQAADRTTAIEKALAELAVARKKLADAAASQPGEVTSLRRLWLAMRRAARQVVLCNPDLGFSEILFATRTGPDSGNITNGSLRDAYGLGGDVYVKSGFAPNDPVKPLLAGRLGPGHLRGLDLHWDAERLVFSYLKQADYDPTKDAVSENTEKGRSEPAHLYEMRIGGSGLRQLTDLKYNSDIEPCYLPSDEIVFVSDRSNYGSQCSGMLHQDKMITNLFRCSAEGKNIRWLSNNKDFDRYPHLMDNGQLLFVHWEYQERHLWQTHTLWTCRPDGSMTDAVYKQHIEGGPMSLREARQIPGQRKLVAVACGHHNGEIGAVMLADYSLGVNNPNGMRLLTPGASGTEGGYGKRPAVEEGGVADNGGHYQFP